MSDLGRDICKKCHTWADDCTCYGEPAPDYCMHSEHDHGICIDCGADVTDRLIERAEALSDLAEDR